MIRLKFRKRQILEIFLQHKLFGKYRGFQLQFDFKGSNKMHLLIFLLQVATSPYVEQRHETGMVICRQEKGSARFC